MKIDIKPFRVRAGQKVRLDQWATHVKPFYKTRHDAEKLLAAHTERMSARQNMLYADDRYALLLIFQAMDAAGKDGAIKHVMSGVNPQGCQVFSFKHPSAEELEHDFLWRTTSRRSSIPGSRSAWGSARIGMTSRSRSGGSAGPSGGDSRCRSSGTWSAPTALSSRGSAGR